VMGLFDRLKKKKDESIEPQKASMPTQAQPMAKSAGGSMGAGAAVKPPPAVAPVGKPSAPTASKTAMDVAGMQKQINAMEKERQEMEKQLKTLEAALKEFAAAKDIARFKTTKNKIDALKSRMAMKQTFILKLEESMNTVMQQSDAKVNIDMLNAATKIANENKVDVEKLQDVMDEHAEAVDQTVELNQIMKQYGMGEGEEEDLLAQMEAMNMEAALETAPSVPVTSPPAKTGVSSSKPNKDKEDDELAALEAEMAAM